MLLSNYQAAEVTEAPGQVKESIVPFTLKDLESIPERKHVRNRQEGRIS